MYRILSAILFIALSISTHAASFVDAVAKVESGNRPLAPYWDVNATRLGYFSISRDVWKDATQFDKSLANGTWEQCQKDKAYGAKVMLAYLRRYCPAAVKANDYQTMARVWNGGPKGATKQATVKYWTKVKKEMEK